MVDEVSIPAEDLRALLRSEGFDAIFDTYPEGMFVFAADGSFVDANPAILAQFGLSLEELRFARFSDVIHPQDRAMAEGEFAASVRGEVRQYAVTGVRRDGTPVRSRITQVPFVHRGRTLAVLGFAADLTRLMATVADDVEGARRSDSRLAAVLGSITDGLLFLDSDFRVTYFNAAAERLTHLTSNDVVGTVLWDIFPKSRDGEFAEAYRRALTEQTTVIVRDYSIPLGAWFDVTAYPTDDGLALYFRDVTEAEKSRQDRARQEAELSAQVAMLDNARDAIVVRGLDSNIRFWNAAATRIYEWTASEATGRSARQLLYNDPSQFDRALATTLAEGYWSGELTQVTKSGASIIVEASWTLIRDKDSQPESIFSVTTDVTEKRREGERALRAQRMESLGTLASGIAHDLNNVLTPILMSVQLLAPGESDPRRREILQSTELAVKRGADMIRQVLSFASGANVRRVPIDLADVIDELQAICGETLPENVSAVFEVGADLWQTRGDTTQLLQVLLNLVSNARDAMPVGGVIRVRAKNITLSDTHYSASHITVPGDYVEVEVEDTGTGIPPKVLDKIFEPFFTTKPTGSGTGLGLSTSLAIIRGHGGYIEAYSEPGHGSVLRLHLPATGKRARWGTPDAPSDELPRGAGELVLVVDDEAAIRMLTRRTLDTYGYTTAVASNGAEAIEFVESGSGRVALVLTDMAMPVMDGAATAHYLLKHHPHIPVVAASGLTANGSGAQDRSSGVRGFLSKPYTTSELLRAVHDALHPDRPETERPEIERPE